MFDGAFSTVKFNREILAVALSVLVQVPLAVFLGHYYDQRSFIDTGYLVSAGFNPYIPNEITFFPNQAFIGVNPIIGYPPLWPLLLGLIYRLTYGVVPNLFLYNFATKIPVILSNIGLAYATKTIMQRLDMPRQRVQAAWLFLLFNPFTLLTTTAWGQFDTLIALLCVASLYYLSQGKIVKSSLLLSLSVVLKPISLSLIGLPLLYAQPNNRKKSLLYLSILVGAVVLLWFLPFYLLGWMPPSSPTQITSYFRMAGGMTLFNSVEIFQKTAILPSSLDFLGYIWIPALLFGYYLVYRNPPKSMFKLAEAAVLLLLVFFLTRTWLSEPNVNLLLPFLLILFCFCEKIGKRTLHLVWIVPFVFLFFNYAVPQLFFLIYPQIIPAIGVFDLPIGVARVTGRFLVTVVWYVVALGILMHSRSVD